MNLRKKTFAGIGAATCAAAILFGMVLFASGEQEEPVAPIRIEISTPKPQVQFREAIPLTITYTNISKEQVVLTAGLPNGLGYPGEWFDVTLGKKTKRYLIFAIDPGVQAIKLEPGKSWTRTIPSLAAELSATHAAVDGKVADGRRLPDPFGHPGEYIIRLGYKNTVQNQPKPEFTGEATSEELKLNIVRF